MSWKGKDRRRGWDNTGSWGGSQAYPGPGWGRGRGPRRGRGGWGRGGPGITGPYPPPGDYGSQPPPGSIQPLPPPPPGALRVLVPTMSGAGLDDTVASMFARAPFFTVIDIVNGEPVNVMPVQNPYAYTGGGAGPMAAQFIVSSNTHVVLAPTIGPNTMPILQSAGIRYIPVQPGIRVADALKTSRLVK